jgi:hypothetical protein
MQAGIESPGEVSNPGDTDFCVLLQPSTTDASKVLRNCWVLLGVRAERVTETTS